MTFGTEVISKLLDLYPAQAALIDEEGKILAVNRAWSEFRNSNGSGNSKLSQPFHPLTERFVRGAGDGSTVRGGIRNILSGAADAFGYSYECLALAGPRWFRLTVTPFSPSEGIRWALLLNTDLTEQQRAEENIVSVCGWCKRIQEGHDLKSFEEYFSKHQGTRFSHGICPECRDMVLQEAPVNSHAHSGAQPTG